MKATEEYSNRVEYTVYKHNKITYIPHYRDIKLYVGPGFHKRYNNVTYKAEELLAGGATPHTMSLWERPKFACEKV